MRDLNLFTLLGVITLLSKTVIVGAQNRGDIDIPDFLNIPDDYPFTDELTTVIEPKTTPTTSTSTTTIQPTTTTTRKPTTTTTTRQPTTTSTTTTTTTATPSDANTSTIKKVTVYISLEKFTTAKKQLSEKKDTVNYLEPEKGPAAPVADVDKSVDYSPEELDRINYIIVGSAIGVVSLITIISITLGILASKGKFSPRGFTPVETSV